MIDDAPENRKTFKTEPGSWFEYFFPDVPAAVAEGRLPAKFTSLDDVGTWVHSHGMSGEPALRMFLTSPDFDADSKRFASVWLQQAEADRVDRRAQEQLQVARNAADAAARSASWTMWAAVAAAIGSIASLFGVAFTVLSDPPEPKVFLLAAPEKSIGPPAPIPLPTASSSVAQAAREAIAPSPAASMTSVPQR